MRQQSADLYPKPDGEQGSVYGPHSGCHSTEVRTAAVPSLGVQVPSYPYLGTLRLAGVSSEADGLT